jgi:hypothetical protein
MAMLTISEFMNKKLDERTKAMVAAEKQRRDEVSRAFQNIGTVFVNSEGWVDLKLYPNMIYLVITDESLDLFRDSMKVLGKELLSFEGGTIYENGMGKNIISIECEYSVEELDNIFEKIVNTLCDRAGCNREVILKLSEDFNNLKDWA